MAKNFQLPHFTSVVEITIICRRVGDGTTPTVAVLYARNADDPSYIEQSRTEKVVSSSPAFQTRLKMKYSFFLRQYVKIEVHSASGGHLDDRTKLGAYECMFAELINRKEVEQLLGGMSSGSIKIVCDEVEACKEAAVLQMEGKKLDKKDLLGKSDPFVEIFYADDDKVTLNDAREPSANCKFVLSHRTEVIRNTLDPLWGVARIPLIRLCCGDRDRPLRFDIYDWDTDKGGAFPSDPKKPHHFPSEQTNAGNDFIGSFYASINLLEELLMESKACFEVINMDAKKKKKSYKNSGTINFKRFSVDIEQTFLDYMFGGTYLNLAVAVDYSKGPQMGYYEEVVKLVGNVVQDYDLDKKFMSYGFGANFAVNQELGNCFPLRMSEGTPYCNSVSAILKAMSQVKVDSAPAPKCAEVVREVAKKANSKVDGSVYYVFLILVTNPIGDVDSLNDILVDASTTPMSVLIVNVGADDPKSQSAFNQDRLRCGRKIAERGNVQYVQISDAQKHGPTLTGLVSKAMADIPYHLVEWMRRRVIIPLNPRPGASPARPDKRKRSKKGKGHANMANQELSTSDDETLSPANECSSHKVVHNILNENADYGIVDSSSKQDHD